MEKIQLDSGIQEYTVNGRETLCFHPGDPNLYARFFEAEDKIQELMTQISARAEHAEANTRTALDLMRETDYEMKKILNWVFGPENDFDRILGGVNLLAVAGNGRQVIENLLDALQPVLMEGAEKCADQQAQAAAMKAEQRRKNAQ